MKSLNSSSLQSLKTVILIMLLGALNLTAAQTEDKVLAVVNGREIRQREVDYLLLSQVMPLEEQLYALRKASLENVVVNTILEAEAARQGISLDGLRNTLSSGKVQVSPEEVESAYAENLSAFGSMSPDEAKERLRLDLETQARMAKYKEAVAELRRTAVVEVLLREPRWPWLAIADNSPSLGPIDSRVTIIEFADFQCSYCRQSQSAIKQLVRDFGKEVRLIFKHFPLDAHSQGMSAARAAFCAGRQGHFWEYHDKLFSLQRVDSANLRNTAETLKLDLTQFDACVNSDESREAVAKDKREGSRWGITSTPTFVVNGKILPGAIDFETFKSLVERELTSVRTTSRLVESGGPNARRRK